MLVSYNWLKNYVDLPDSLTPEEVAEKLKLATVEVEGVKQLGEELENIVVGEVRKVEKHPNADKLKICTVYDGQKTYQVVCGGSNLREGMKVAFARIGARIKWHGEGEMVELKEAEIRGVKSFGMICSSTEIGLGEMFSLREEKEIMDLGDKIIGRPLAEVLGLDDVVFEIDHKSLSHRPDLWGHYGMAREVAAIYNKRLKDYKICPERSREIKRLKEGKNWEVRVEVEDKKLCPRYMAVAVSGIKVAPSPEWLRSRLTAVGVRSINNIVDITNYVMLDLGQPMHAFDASRLNPKSEIRNPKIVVRRAKEGEMFATLDGQEHRLTNEMLVIADEEKAIALAGVMGGENSEINEKTKTIIFESANFNAANVRRTALKLGLRTESSARFEKGLDPNWCELALRRAVQLTLDICPEARVVSPEVDAKHFRLNQGPIKLSMEFLNKRIGTDIKKAQAFNSLKGLGFAVKEKKKDILAVIAPTWRATKDISIPEDLVEEVARLHGYDRLPATLPVCSIAPPEINRLRQLERKVMETLVRELSYTEVYNYSFVSSAQVERLGDDLKKYLELDNPVSKEKPFLRRRLLLNLLENLEKNLAWFDEVKLAEIGKVFRLEEKGEKVKAGEREELPGQDTWLTAVWAGKKETSPFWPARRAVETIFAGLNLEWQTQPIKNSKPWRHPGRQAALICQGKEVGLCYELNPLVGEKFGLPTRVGVLEINLNRLLEVRGGLSRYAPVPSYPEMARDIAFLVDKKVSHESVVKTLQSVDPLLKDAELFDVYEGGQIGSDKKSLAFHISYQSPDRTLTTEEVEAVHQKLIQKMERELGAEVRGV